MKVFIYLFCLTLCIGCKSKQFDSVAESQLDHLTFTSGGGFAGKYTTYILLTNGQIFSKNIGQEDTNLVGKISQKEADQIFSNYDFLGLEKEDFLKYGNYTYTINMDRDGKTHKIQWEKDMEGSSTFQLYYKNAMNAIGKAVNGKPKKNNIKADIK